MKFLEVAVAAPLDHTLTYLPPPAPSIKLVPGLRLLVPLSGRQVTGYLLGTQPPSHPSLAAGRLRAVVDILDDSPLFPAELVPFFRWIANYYHYPIGRVITSALPAGLTVKSGRRGVLTDAGRKAITGLYNTSHHAADQPWVAELLAKGFLSPAMIRRLSCTADRQLLNEWQKNGWLEMVQSVPKSRVKTRAEMFVEPARLYESFATGHDIVADLKPSERKTLEILKELIRGEPSLPPTSIPRKELTRLYPGAGMALRGLAAKEIITLAERPVYRDPFGQNTPFMAEPEKLTVEQETTLNRLLPSIAQKKFAPFLLHGVTGSGKTEVYLQAAAAALRSSRSVLILVPEIALATQLEAYFLSRFGDQVALLHSGLTGGEFYDQWLRIMRGDAKVVIGARSAVFAPLADPGLIVVDEEHDSSYKQEDGFRYHARDLAILRGSMSRSVVLLGSATPSVSSSYHAECGKYTRLTLSTRISHQPLPAVHIEDLRKVKTVSGRPPLFSPRLVAELRDNLACGQQSLIFLNRRGYANMVLCNDCGYILQCANCHITLTLHKGRNQLLCHYCGFSTHSDQVCPQCSSVHMVRVGFGTERIEHELAALLPGARLARLDRDTCAKRRDYLTVLKAMLNREVDILIGTQMIAKGHHFPNVTLVGIVWADAGLGVPDFRAAERTFQLLTQVTGRAGRGERPGRVVVQTHQPEHYSIALARRNDYRTIYEKEMSLRKELGFPPFARMINLRISGADEDAVRGAALYLARFAAKHNRQSGAVRILGPVPAPLTRLRGKFRWQLLLLGEELESLHRLCRWLQQQAKTMPLAKKVTVSVDVDPENLL
jgi:primosomal protein N' (replication factor Y)